jgi:tetratricopeptide (TPR) repeat protein
MAHPHHPHPPDSVTGLCQAGLAHLLADHIDAAERDFRAAIAQRPDHPPALMALGTIAWRQQRYPQALGYARRAAEIAPAHPAHHLLLARILRDSGDLPAAAAAFRTALHRNPADNAARLELAQTLLAAGRLDDAILCYRRALRSEPARTEAQYGLGLALFHHTRFAEAADAFRTVLALQPDHPDAANNLGSALIEAGQFAAAEPILRQAVQHQPGLAGPLSNLGAALRGNGDTPAAERCFRAALHIDPAHIEARYNLATTLLQTGRLRQGWAQYEIRWQTPGLPPRPFPQPRWTGETLPDGALLLHAEQGLGDTLQFCRYVRLAAQRATVILEVQKPLLRLAALSFPEAAHIIATGDPIPTFHRHCPLLSLPLVFDTTLETIPAATPYLQPDPAEAAHWRDRLATLPGLRVGLVWAGNQKYVVGQLKRDMPASHLQALHGIPGISFVSLQKDHPPGPPPPLPMTDWTAEWGDFATTAAIVAGLDLVIGVDTAVIHLAAALNRPTWLLNRFDSDWRWLRTREDSPWYPTIRQFRPAAMHGWAGIMARLSPALAAAACHHRSPRNTPASPCPTGTVPAA